MAEQNRPTSGGSFHSTGRMSGEPPVQKAREKAMNYRESRQEGDKRTKGQGPVRGMGEWADIVSQRIEEAARRGAFDNLPGQGKPLDFQRDPFTPEDQQMANTLLKNNDLTPAWIADRKDLLHDIEKFRAKLRSASTEMQTQYARASDTILRAGLVQTWQVWVEEWTEEGKRLNKRILDQNLRQPVAHLEILKIRLDEEVERAGISRYFESI